MQRRSAVGRIAGTLAGLSLVQVPNLDAGIPLSSRPFSVTHANLAESAGTVTCSICQQTWDSLDLTPAGLCLRCADEHPTIKVEPRSDPFWTLSRREVRRVEAEMERLAADLHRMKQRFAELRQRQIAEGGDVYDRAMEAGRDEWNAVQRELHLLHLLRAASRQFSS